MIGIFDSGFGGLTIYKSIEKVLPQYDYVYLGDNARTPYGNRSQEVIYEYARQAVDFLFKQGCDLIILACNTTSAEALQRLQQEYLPKKYPNKNVLGVIRPLVEEAAITTKNKTIAVMGTRSTVESKSYIKELHKLDDKLKIVQKACPLLVPLIEESWERRPETKMILKKYIRPLKNIQPDTVILGCTHYGWLQNEIQNYFGRKTKVLDSSKIVSDKLAIYLKKHPQFAKVSDSKPPKRAFFTTESSDKFEASAQKYLGYKIEAKKIELI